jgi:hypothetical protein
VHDDEIVVTGLGEDILDRGAVGGRIDQFAARHERGRLREPGRIPERADFALRLVACARSAVEAVE